MKGAIEYMKKITALILTLILALGMLAGCKKDNEDTVDSDDVASTVFGESDASSAYDPVLDTLDFDGVEVTFYYADLSDATRLEFYAEDYSGDNINKVIYERNVNTQKKFNVSLSFVHEEGAEMTDDLRIKYYAEDPTYDIIAAYAYYGAELALEGIYADLYTVDYINPSSSWWNQSYVDAVTYQNQLYNIVGDINTSITSKTLSTFVNKDMMADEHLDVDLFSVVDEGEWTLEYMINLCKDVYHEDDDIPDRSDGDKYGFILGQISQPAESLLVSNGFTWSRENEDGSISLTLSDAHNIDILTKLESLYSGTYTGIYKMPAEGDFAKYGAQNYSKLFSSEKTMVTIAPLYTAEVLRETKIDYLILPLPKYDTDKTEYRTSALDSHCNIGISSISDAKSAAGAVLEYMGYLSEKELTPAYFDISYKVQYASDPNTMKLFDTVVDSVVFDFARTYSRSIHDVTKKMRTLVSNSEEISSSIATYEDACQGYLDILVLKFQGLNG